jgi:hypothetical protein
MKPLELHPFPESLEAVDRALSMTDFNWRWLRVLTRWWLIGKEIEIEL